MASASSNRTAAVALALTTKQSSINGFTASDLTSLQNALTAAANALQAEIDRVSQQESQWLQTTQMGFYEARMQADQLAENAFQQASESANEASMNTSMAIEKRRYDAYEDLQNGDISQAQYDSISAAVDADLQVEAERLAKEVSGYQKTRDDALVENAATESVDSAAAQKASADRVADAGAAQAATLRQAEKDLSAAQIANQYGSDRTESEANVQYFRDVAAADKVYSDAKADADAAKASAIRVAAAIRDKAIEDASHGLTVATANATATAVATSVAGDPSASAAYQVAAANADRDAEIARADAAKTQTHARIDADRDLDLALIKAAKQQAKDDALADHVRDGDIATAASTFRLAYLNKLEQNATEGKDFEKDAAAARDGAQRVFDKDMAAVQKIRTTRDASDLKQNRKDMEFARNERDHHLITQSEYDARVATLNDQAADLRRQIAEDTFGNPSTSGGSSGGTTESAARTKWLTEVNDANNELADQKRQKSDALTQEHASLAANARQRRCRCGEKVRERQIDRACIVPNIRHHCDGNMDYRDLQCRGDAPGFACRCRRTACDRHGDGNVRFLHNSSLRLRKRCRQLRRQ